MDCSFWFGEESLWLGRAKIKTPKGSEPLFDKKSNKSHNTSCKRVKFQIDGLFRINRGKKMLGVIAELWRFMRVRKKFWLLPIIIVMLIFGALIVLTQGSAVAPFIYTVF